MNLQRTLLSALVAGATATAVPTAKAVDFFFGDNTLGNTGLNNIELINRENIYRASTACTPTTCLAFNAATDPAGYQRPNPAVANNILPGDLFVGILNMRQVNNIDQGTSWTQDNTPPGIDSFTGYFVQQVQSAPAAIAGGTSSRILLETPTVADPFGIVDTVAGESLRFFVDKSLTPFTSSGLGLTALQSIQAATDGQLWATLGIGATPAGTSSAAPLFDGDGYAFSEANIGGGLQTFGGTFYVAYNILSQGPAYNAGKINRLNDVSEILFFGAGLGDPLNIGFTATNNYFGICTPSATYACNDIVGNGQLSANSEFNSPWTFASDDPLYLNATVPEPASLALLGLGLLGLGASLRRRAK